MKFLKGAAAQKEVAKVEARREEMMKGRIFRFGIPEGVEARVTFLDGELNADGVLESGSGLYYEHNIFMNGNWRNWFPCLSDAGDCPLCDGGDSSSLVGAFTVIDHTKWTDKKGKVHQHEPKLYVAKQGTMKQLQNIATKRGGLTGATFDISRAGDKSARAGNQFDFVGKKPLTFILSKFTEIKGPYEYEEAIVERSADELRALGFGGTVVGSEKGVTETKAPAEKEDNAPFDYSTDL